MRTAENWKDYELLDATEGYRLERWGSVLLQRPDPQVIWQTPRACPEWDRVDALYHRSEKGGGEWEYRSKARGKKLPDRWEIGYTLPGPATQTGSADGDASAIQAGPALRLAVSPTGFKHTGIFPEQAVNWDEYTRLITGAARPVKVLNLFGYTGGATLACAAAGAALTHVDASKGMVAWARENASLSGLADRPIRWLVDDCGKFVQRELRRGNRYDAIIMDPPSYGRGPTGEIWKLEESLYPLLAQCVGLLSDNPLFFSLSSYTTGLAPGVMGYMLNALLCPQYGGRVHSDEIGLPVVASKGVLPCGATSIWHR